MLDFQGFRSGPGYALPKNCIDAPRKLARAILLAPPLEKNGTSKQQLPQVRDNCRIPLARRPEASRPTRIIVFAVRPSVKLKAALALSSVETLPAAWLNNVVGDVVARFARCNLLSKDGASSLKRPKSRQQTSPGRKSQGLQEIVLMAATSMPPPYRYRHPSNKPGA